MAEATPAPKGTATERIPNSAARAATWTGPAPPNATRVKWRGSMPRCTVTSRIAPAIVALAISWTAAAASETSSPSGSATDASARSARAAESVTPPASPSGSR